MTTQRRYVVSDYRVAKDMGSQLVTHAITLQPAEILPLQHINMLKPALSLLRRA
jgi:hypothetical protein